MTRDSPDGVPADAEELWEDLVAQAEHRGEEYRDVGWDAIVVHPDDVTVLLDDTRGLDVSVDDEEFEALQAVVDRASFDTSHVYRADEGDTRLVVLAIEASDDEAAVVVPTFYDVEEGEPLVERALEEGRMLVHVGPSEDGKRVSFSHDEPEHFA